METNKNIFFIGFMGCGKSTMARLLSEKTGMELVEMDETIEAEAGMTINKIFEMQLHVLDRIFYCIMLASSALCCRRQDINVRSG